MTDEARPVLRVVAGGTPTDEELAALVVVVTRAATGADEPPVPRSAWADRTAMLRRPLRHGPGRWRRFG